MPDEMKSSSQKAGTIDEYITAFPPHVQQILQQVRSTIHEAAPQATEAISYGMPTFKLYGNLIHFAGYEHHIGLYPTPSGIAEFEQELSVYKSAKGSVQFPLDQPMPYELIGKITAFRVRENLAKAEAKRKTRT